MYGFVTIKNKDGHLHIRLKPSVKDELKIVADARGMTMSGLVYSLIVKTIREEKNQEPQLFDEVRLAPVVARISSEKAEIQHQFEQGIPLAATSKNKLPFVKTTQEKKRKAR